MRKCLRYSATYLASSQELESLALRFAFICIASEGSSLEAREKLREVIEGLEEEG